MFKKYKSVFISYCQNTSARKHTCSTVLETSNVTMFAFLCFARYLKFNFATSKGIPTTQSAFKETLCQGRWKQEKVGFIYCMKNEMWKNFHLEEWKILIWKREKVGFIYCMKNETAKNFHLEEWKISIWKQEKVGFIYCMKNEMTKNFYLEVWKISILNTVESKTLHTPTK